MWCSFGACLLKKGAVMDKNSFSQGSHFKKKTDRVKQGLTISRIDAKDACRRLKGRERFSKEKLWYPTVISIFMYCSL